MIDGLRGEAPADDRSMVTLESLASFADQRVREWVRRRRPLHQRRDTGISPHFEPLAIREMPLLLRARHADSTPGRMLEFPEPEAPPPWSTGFARDRFGLWAELTVGKARQRFRFVKARSCWQGSLLMRGRIDGELPLHKAYLDQPYWIAETPCTQQMWKVVTGGGFSAFRGENRPVENVSLAEIDSFFPRLYELTGGEIEAGLPTEVEWECACRAGAKSDWPNNEDSGDPRNRQACFKPYSRGETRDVATLQPNSWGLYDLLGNVWEVCAPPTVTGGARFAKGGSWADEIRRIRAGARLVRYAGEKSSTVGFRIVVR